MGVSLLLLAWLTAVEQADSQAGEISGTVVNGTDGEAPLAGAEVVLRVSQDGAFIPLAETTTDAQGRFCFSDLPADPGLIYLPGANRAGIHYPGPRVRLAPGQPVALVKVIAFDTVESPSPLINRRHEIVVEPGAGFLEVSETLLIENPSATTFVGTTKDDRPTTLRLSLPAGIEKVTFDREFHGRNFQLHEGRLTTDLPWPPGSRELKFLYRVPVEQRYSILQRVLDLPTEQVVVRVRAKDAAAAACNLPPAPSPPGQERVFEHRGKVLPAGYEISLQLGAVPLRFESYARWLALAALGALVAGAAWAAGGRRRDRSAGQESAVPAAAGQSAARGGRPRRTQRLASSRSHR